MQRFSIHSFKILLVLTGLVVMPGCLNLAQSRLSLMSHPLTGDLTTVLELQKKRPIDTTVYLKGKVISRVPLLGEQVYQLQDTTGMIWVLTKAAIPTSGEEVLIKGLVRYKKIPLNGKDQGSLYLELIEQLEPQPTS
ncbi:MAG: hypothetical protein KME16_10755 [Scytolyngbya sp. HA4215-MV1]|jgi:uncharacterized protein YdeI (BOF family)|nr:hypothetical protein [Scytolyngbya sp. HA4215-MV1]